MQLYRLHPVPVEARVISNKINLVGGRNPPLSKIHLSHVQIGSLGLAPAFALFFGQVFEFCFALSHKVSCLLGPPGPAGIIRPLTGCKIILLFILFQDGNGTGANPRDPQGKLSFK